MTLVDFLLARYAEEEPLRDAGRCTDGREMLYVTRQRRDLEAKRRIVEEARSYSPELEYGDNGEWAFDVTLRALASVYADHPDYREEWRA